MISSTRMMIVRRHTPSHGPSHLHRRILLGDIFECALERTKEKCG